MAETVTVLGGGSWGTALAWLLSRKGEATRLWCRNPEQAAAMRQERRNRQYLPDLPLPDALEITADLAASLAGATVCIAAVPTQSLRGLMAQLEGPLGPSLPVVFAAKGLEAGSGLTVTGIARAGRVPLSPDRLAVLSGPNLAGEMTRGIPTSTVIASENAALAARLQVLFGATAFRVYTNTDVLGVEFGGALKNPIAVAAGISDGLGFGQNTKAALITRGLAEMTRLGRAAGARAMTFAGLSGLGDLVATCQSPMSRNYRLGNALGRGAGLEDALRELGQVAEGVPTCEAACLLAARLGVEVPITAELREVLFRGKPPFDAVSSLMTRDFREEHDD